MNKTVLLLLLTFQLSYAQGVNNSTTLNLTDGVTVTVRGNYTHEANAVVNLEAGTVLNIEGSMTDNGGSFSGDGEIYLNEIDIYGCTDSTACNYNPDATIDDGSCAYEVDCNGICGGGAVLDCFDVCEGDAVEDCTGECGGDAEIDDCGVCDGDNECLESFIYSFTTCGTSGRYGPTQNDCNAEYENTTLGNSVIVDNGLQTWIVPKTGYYSFEGFGAEGGYNMFDSTYYCTLELERALGAEVSGKILLNEGEILQIIIGQQGIKDNGDCSSGGSGGGGATIVKTPGNSLFLAAAGGGGSGVTNENWTQGPCDGICEVEYQSGRHGDENQDGTSSPSGATTGTTATGSGLYSSGGLGWASISSNNFIGREGYGYNNHGGFGGGGGCADHHGGGGAGFSGGGGAGDPVLYNLIIGGGGGGGSFNELTIDAVKLTGMNEGNGSLTIIDLSYLGCTNPEACNYSEEAIFDDGSCIYGDTCYGCTNPDAMNYNPDAVFDDGSCILPDIIVPDNYSTIQGALDASSDGNTIYVRAGTYYEHNIIWPTISGIQLIGENMETTIVDANGNGNGIIITPENGQHNNSVINASTLISGFTIQNGYANGSYYSWVVGEVTQGGAIHSYYAHISLNNMIFKNNLSQSDGGALFMNDNTNVIPGTTINYNNLFFLDNQAMSGSGGAHIQINGENLFVNLNNNQFINNTATNANGGLYISIGDNLSVNDCIFDGNQSIESYNAAYSTSTNSPYFITNSIFINNQCSGRILDSFSALLVNSIVYNNNQEANVLNIESAYHCLISNFSYEDNPCVNCLDGDPLFTNPDIEDYTLLPESPCIDSGIDYLEYGELIYMANEYDGFAPDIGLSINETSQMFVPDPIITGIVDVPEDQGGRVYIDFQRSFHDKDGLTNRVEVYTIERYDAGQWVGVLTQSAYNDSSYRVEVTTLSDSSSTSDGVSDYRVQFC